MRLFLLLLFVLVPSLTAFAEEGFPNRFYAGISRGVSDVSNAEIIDRSDDSRSTAVFKRDLFASLVGGLDVGRGRYELEYDYRQSDLDRLGDAGGPFSGDVTVHALMFNAYGDLENRTRFTPYLGFGFGAAKISINDWQSLDTPLIDDTDYLLAFQVMTGVHTAVNDRWGVDLTYRYFNTSYPEFKDAAGRSIESDYRSNTVAIGARYYFR